MINTQAAGLYNRRIERMQPLISPKEMLERIPVPLKAVQTVLNGRNTVEAILRGIDTRFLLIVGPCSIHDTVAAFDYAQRLAHISRLYADVLYVVMRVYFEKPRTKLGWRGLIVEPALDGIINIPAGLDAARNVLVRIASLGLPAASELLDPIVAQYIADLISWASIGARSAESQIHREMASGLSMPVGFKNPTDGDISRAIYGIVSARASHAFLGVMQNGCSAVMHTAGNEDAHLILRGSSSQPNCDRATVKKSCLLLEQHGIAPAVLIDCSHDNSQKDPNRQCRILLESIIMKHDAACPLTAIRGCMMESFIREGSAAGCCHKVPESYGLSITDPCMGWTMTESAISKAAQLLRSLKAEMP